MKNFPIAYNANHSKHCKTNLLVTISIDGQKSPKLKRKSY